MSTIKTGTTLTTAYQVEGDTTGALVIQTGATPTTALTISDAQVATFAQAPVLPAASIPQAALAANVAGNGPAFSAYQSTQQTSISVNTATKILFQTEDFDTNNNFSSSRFTPTVAGYYLFSSTVANGGSSWSNGYMTVNVYVNGGPYRQTTTQPTNGNWVSTSITATVYLNGSTDYVEIYALCNGISAAWSTSPSTAYNWFSGALVRAA